MMPDILDPDAGFGLYVHWPFCRKKCPYCDFNSHVRDGVDHEAWRRALVDGLTRQAAEMPGRGPLTSIFFGGGTPSLMEPETVSAIIAAADRGLGLSRDCEITLEANPTSVEAGKLVGFRAAGVNRVSLGVQALVDADLRALGREHSAEEAMAAVRLARKTFGRISFDLIYTRPEQSADAWAEELDTALAEGPDHLSVYQLTIEPGTKFALEHQAGRLQIPEEGLAADLYEATQAQLTTAGLPAYEISNHARPGFECRHNLTYWRMGDYLGIGPGAHGRVTLQSSGGWRRYATRSHRAPEIWLEKTLHADPGDPGRIPLDEEEAAVEAVMMGLRLAEGVPLRRLEGLSGRAWTEMLDSVALDRLVLGGFLEPVDDRLIATVEGRQRLDALLPRLLR